MALLFPGKYAGWTQDLNWTYIRRSEDLLNILCTYYVRSIYVLCSGGSLQTLAFKKKGISFQINSVVNHYIIVYHLRNENLSLREKCLNTEYFPAFGLNTGKCGPEKTPYLDTFHVAYCLWYDRDSQWNWFWKKNFSYEKIHHQILQKQPFADVFQNRCSWKFQQYSQESTCVGVCVIKLEALRPATVLKRDSNIGAVFT